MYAQVDLTCHTTPKTCYEAPEEIQTYLEVMNKIISIVDNIEWVKKNEKSWVSRITTETEAERNLVWSIATEVLTNTSQFGDTFQDFKSLQYSEAIKRDRQKLTELNARLVESIQKLTLNKRRSGETISKNILDLEKIDDEIKKLKYLSLAQSGKQETYNLYNNTYSDLIQLLIQINNSYKELYYVNFYQQAYVAIDESSSIITEDDNVGAISEAQEQLTNRIYEDAFEDIRDNTSDATRHVIVNKVVLYQEIKKIENAYRCASGKKNVCDDGLEKSQEKNKVLDTQRIKKDGNKAVQIIKEANSRLRWALFSKDKGDQELLKKREESLDKSQRWTWWPPEKWFPAFIRGPSKKISAYISELWKEFWATTDPLQEFSSNIKTADEGFGEKPLDQQNTESVKDKEGVEDANAKKREDQPKEELWKSSASRLDQSLIEYQNDAERKFKDSMQKYVIQTSDDMHTDLLHENVAMATKQMVAVSTKVHAAANKLWDYDKQDTINNNMSIMCENQCTNLKDKKCKTKQ